MTVIIRVRPCLASKLLRAALKRVRPLMHLTPMSLMRNLGIAAAGWALCAPVVVNHSGVFPTPERAVYPDPRAAKLDAFFRYYNCPEPFHVLEYLRATDGYGLDYRLLPAISIRETQCGVQERNVNNRWGYDPGRLAFPSVEAGINYVARQLAENPVYKGKTLYDKLYTYNPLPAYPDEVRRIMRQIEKPQETGE